MPVTPEGMALAIVSAAVYSIVFFFKKYASDNPEEFKWKKLLATLIVGVVIGAVYGYMGFDITQMLIFEQLAMYAGTIAIVESIIKIIWRTYKKNKRDQYSPYE